MKIAYLDLFCGLSGDITLGAMVDAGLPLADLKRGLAKLRLKGYALSSRRVMKGAISATKVDVTIAGQRQTPHGHDHGHHHGHTSLKEILELIRRSSLPEAVKASSSDCFRRLGEVEGRIHGIPTMKVRFHEVGAVDSIVDIVGACLGFHLLGVGKVYCSRVPVGHGTIHTQHGALPNPGPATMGLLAGFPLVPVDIAREILTPTGAALLATWVREPGRFPEMSMTASGWGAGEWDLPERANVARLILGDAVDPESSDVVSLIETNLDNATGELVGHLFDRLFAAGALDVYTTAIQMKKSRPGVVISILAPPSRRTALGEILLRETPSFGVRHTLLERTKLHRRELKVRTRFGPIRLKEGSLNGETVKASPEYEDCRSAARAHDVPLSRVVEAALEAYRKQKKT